jgi:hypothetical protein
VTAEHKKLDQHAHRGAPCEEVGVFFNTRKLELDRWRLERECVMCAWWCLLNGNRWRRKRSMWWEGETLPGGAWIC